MALYNCTGPLILRIAAARHAPYSFLKVGPSEGQKCSLPQELAPSSCTGALFQNKSPTQMVRTFGGPLHTFDWHEILSNRSTDSLKLSQRSTNKRRSITVQAGIASSMLRKSTNRDPHQAFAFSNMIRFDFQLAFNWQLGGPGAPPLKLEKKVFVFPYRKIQ